MDRDGWVDELLDRLDRIARALEGLGTRPPSRDGPPAEGRAFVWAGAEGFRPVQRPAAVDPELLTGIDRQRRCLYADVERFLAGRPAHDVLLWGERGTGKSSLVRSLLTAFGQEGPVLLEVPETRLPDLPAVLERLAADPRRWVLYLDDLGFRGPEDHYRELKVLLEGGLEARPGNTLVVATSNRRHLVPEPFSAGEEIHPEEAVAEAVSLADRFGLSLGFYSFDEPTYLEAVRRHLASLGVAAPPAGWEEAARRWAMARGIRSGRSAWQAAREIAGATPLPA
ncbi:MAG: ATP-binding protein [Deferrisomatales bacterium]